MPDLDTLQVPRYLHKPSVPPDWISRLVTTRDECEQALAEGWCIHASILTDAPVAEPVADVPVPDETPVDVILDAPKRKGWPAGKKRGPRKPKEVTP